MPTHAAWLSRATPRYGFSDVDETLRHLLYLANAEPSNQKRLIFRIKRCLHCHVGARAGQHKKTLIVMRVHRFQYEWLEAVTAKCQIASVEKAVRIVCDFYQSRVEQARQEGGEGAADAKEAALFGERREHDPRWEAAMLKLAEAGGGSCSGGGGDGTTEESIMGCNLLNLAQDPAACSPEETRIAIEKCQVGRHSQTYADARGENAEETAHRRAAEELVENSEEAKRARDFIARTLGSIMG